jgi:hypothetical protein
MGAPAYQKYIFQLNGIIHKAYNEITIEGDIARITLYDNMKQPYDYAIIDVEDAERVAMFRWTKHNKGYVWNVSSHTMLHHFIIGYKTNYEAGVEVDHANRNKLDNRKYNIRKVMKSVNQHNSKIRVDNTTGFKGVAKFQGTRYRARIQVNNKRISLGLFDCPIEAALAYNEAAVKYFGEYAILNVIA